MKRLLSFLLLFGLPLAQQGPPSTYVPQLISFPGAPVGVCDIYQIALNNSTGQYYSCTPGTRVWTTVNALVSPATYNSTTGVLTLGTGNGFSGVLNLVGSGPNTVGIGVTTGGTTPYTIRLPAVNSTANGQVLSHLGNLSATDPVLIWSDQVQLAVVATASLPACNNASEGEERGVTDSNTATWGATVAAGGANHILAYCDGTVWTVAGK